MKKVIRSGESEPIQPHNGEVQIRVAFAGICGTDLHVYHGNMDSRGGPIGALIAMVARAEGEKVLISEINPYRLKLLGGLGFNTINPLEEDIKA